MLDRGHGSFNLFADCVERFLNIRRDTPFAFRNLLLDLVRKLSEGRSHEIGRVRGFVRGRPSDRIHINLGFTLEITHHRTPEIIHRTLVQPLVTEVIQHVKACPSSRLIVAAELRS
ncbi:MAG: hypothetical protein ABEJ27_06125 [Halodesulfurarchaeum sp.]